MKNYKKKKEIPKKKPITSKEITVTLGLKKLLIPALAVVSIVVIGLIIWSPWAKRELVPMSSGKPSLAVMYFKNNTGDESENNLRRAFSDLLITGLTKSKYLKVLSGDKLLGILRQLNLQESESYSSEDLKKVTALGGVTHIVQGNYIKIAEIYRINILLQDARTMELISTETQEGKEEDFYMMVDELTKKIKMSFELSEKEIADDIDLADELAAEGFAKGAVIARGDIEPPKLIKSVPPVYPEEARQKRIEGVVIVEARTDKKGNMEAAKILKSIPLLDQAAIDATKQWKYEPMIIDGKATAVVFTITMRFKLKEKKQRTESISEMQWTNSIAVLPFKDLSPQKDQGYLCDGFAESLIHALTKVKDLRVPARTSSFSFKGKEQDIREIGKKLNVKTILEGSVQKAGNRARITAQLIKVADGSLLWSEQYNRELNDVFAIQDEITLAIMDKLKVKLLGEEKAKLVKRYTENLEAYNLYLRGRHFSNKHTEAGYKKSIEYFEKAINLDKTYALAYVGLAGCYKELSRTFYLSRNEGYPKAKEALMKALELDETLGEAHAILGSIKFISEWDIFGPELYFQRAIELSPGSAYIYRLYAGYLGWLGRHDKSIAIAKRALELDPLTPINNWLGWAYFYASRYDESISQLKNMLILDPQFVWAHVYLANNYTMKGMYAEAIVHADKVESIGLSVDDYLILSSVGWAYARSGRQEKAQAILEKLLGLPKERSIDPMMLAEIYAGLGDRDKAFDWLTKAYEARSGLMVYLKAYGQTFLKDLSSDPRYIELLNKMGFEK